MNQYELPASLSIPYGDIDAEHQGLIDILNAALRLLSPDGNTPVNFLLPLLQNLHDDLVRHFRNEEAEMLKLGYPELAQHSAHHANCARQLDGIRAEVLAGRRSFDRNLLDDLYDMILGDIIRADSGFKSFLHSRNMVASELR